MYSIAYCEYQFACTCGASYISRITRLSECIKEHRSNWLSKRSTMNEQTVITIAQLVSYHLSNTGEAFRPAHIVC